MTSPRPSSRRAGALLVVAAAVLWGTTGTTQALGPDDTTPLTVGTVRILLGGVALLALVLARPGGPGQVRALGHRRQRGALLVGAVAVAAYQVAFFAGVDRAGVALGTVVGIGSAPVMTGLLQWALDRRPPPAGWWPATGLAIVGAALLLAPDDGVEAADPLGIVLALGAGLAYACYTIAAKRSLDRHGAPTAVMAVIFAGGAVLLLPLLAGADLRWLATPSGLLAAAWLGLGTTALAYVLFGRGLAAVHPATAATASLAEPLTAAALGLVVLGERPGPLGHLGGLLVLAGLVVLSLRR